MNYYEDRKDTTTQRKDYLNSIEKLIEKRQNECKSKREKYIKKIINEPGKAREEYFEMLGWPLTIDVTEPLSVEKTLLSCEQDGYNIYRMKLEIFKDFFFYGLYFEHRNQKNLPFVISQHGGDGTPELCSGLYNRCSELYNGGTANYNNMTERVLKRGANVFAPQTLLWHKENNGIEFDRRDLDSKLKQVGGSIAALEIYCIKSSLNYFEKQLCIDNDRIGMVGLSYGGFYTLFTMAADTRIKAAVSSAFFNDRSKYSWSDFTWKCSAEKFFDSEVALLCYPRKLWLSVGEKDELFDIGTVKSEYKRLCREIEMCDIKSDWLNFEIHSGTQEFCADDKAIDYMFDVGFNQKHINFD